MTYFLFNLCLVCTIFTYTLTSQLNTTDPTVVGGNVANPSEWRWQAGLLISGKNSNTYGCGGAFIHEQYVVTAAHCICNLTAGGQHFGSENCTDTIANNPSDIRVSLGNYRLYDIDPDEVVMLVSQFWINPNMHDMAILELESPVSPTAYRQIISLGCTAPADGSPVWATGWGVVNAATYGIPNTLQEIQLNVDMSICHQPLICADKPGATEYQNICFGDSGGPLVQSKMVNGQLQWELIGITSVTINSQSCTHPTGFGGFASIPDSCDWIKAKIYPKICCNASKIPQYANSVNVSTLPETPIDGCVQTAIISNCYKVDRIKDQTSITQVCHSAHTFNSVMEVQVDCIGSPGQPGVWGSFPGCIPLSAPAGGDAKLVVQNMDRPGDDIPGGIKWNVASNAICGEICKNFNETDKPPCVSYVYLAPDAPFWNGSCWLKSKVPPLKNVTFTALAGHMQNGHIESTILCDDETKRPCDKWCDGVADCPNGEDELGCPDPCNTIHTAANNECGSSLKDSGQAPVEGGRYFKCGPSECLSCSKVCEDRLYGFKANCTAVSEAVPLDEQREVNQTCY